MLTKLIRMLLISYGCFLIYQNRYKVLNKLLGNEKIRGWAVSTSMNIPFIRNAFIQSAFRS